MADAAPRPSPHHRHARLPLRVVVPLALAAAVATVLVVALATNHGSAPASGSSPLSTAQVTRQTVSTQQLVNATLGYVTDAATVGTATGGTVDAVPALGSSLKRGAVLYRIDSNPVVVMYGSLPSFRTLVQGIAGRDVLELNRNLKSLGLLAGAPGDRFGPQTARAVRTLQARTGGTVTGFVALGAVFYVGGPVRVQGVSAIVGESLQPGIAVLQIAADERVVTSPLTPTQATEIKVGDDVGIQLPSGETTPGRVTAISRVATTASPDSQSTPATQSADPSMGTTINATIALLHPRDAGNLDQAPVTVAITTQTAPDAMTVPVSSLLARPDGSYAVQVARRSMVSTVSVTPGLYSDTTDAVAVTSDRLHVGERVVVPS